MKIEVLGTERRRRWSLQDKVRIVDETMQPGVTVTEVARRHGLAPSVVFTGAGWPAKDGLATLVPPSYRSRLRPCRCRPRLWDPHRGALA